MILTTKKVTKVMLMISTETILKKNLTSLLVFQAFIFLQLIQLEQCWLLLMMEQLSCGRAKSRMSSTLKY